MKACWLRRRDSMLIGRESLDPGEHMNRLKDYLQLLNSVLLSLLAVLKIVRELLK